LDGGEDGDCVMEGADVVEAVAQGAFFLIHLPG
jgi:hypothetical protein